MGNGIVSSIFEKRFHPGNEPPDWWDKIGGVTETLAGVNVTPENSLQVSAVYACVNVLSQTLAMLPLIIYKRLPRGKTRAQDFYLYDLLHNLPNPEMTSYDLRHTMQGHLGIRGNCYSELVFDRSGQIKEIWPLRPDKMRLIRDDSGKLVYEYTMPEKFGARKKNFRMEQIWHIRGLSTNGLVGLSQIQQAMQAVGLSVAAEGYGARLFANDAKPGFVLTHPETLSDQAYERLKNSWEDRHRGWDRSHRIAILEEGMKPEQIGITPEESQFIETRNYQAKEIARFYRIPLHKIGIMDNATFSNIEHQSIEFVVDTIMPWLTNWEQSIYRCLLLESERETYFAEHLVDALLRGDTLARYQAYQSGIQAGWLVRNEAREKENLNPIDGLDEPLQPLNMATVSQMAEMDGSDDEDPQRNAPPSPAPSPEPSPGLSLEGRGELLEERSKKSAQTRHRLMRTYRRVFEDALGRIVRREVNDVGNQAKKMLVQRDSVLFLDWVSQFYREHEEFIKRQLMPVVSAYMELVAEAAGDEVKKQADEKEVGKFVRDYMNVYAPRHTGNQVVRVKKAVQKAVEANEDPLPAVERELEGWSDRPAEIADEESVRANNAISKFVYTLAGVTKLMSVAFGKNCPYCNHLNGKIIEINSNFLDAGVEFKPDGADSPLVVHSSKGHPPYHKGCDCMITAVFG